MFFSLTVVVLFNRLHRVYAVWFQISDFAFYNEFTFSTKTLAYLAYKTYKAFNAFMAFKRSRFCPIQNYRSITSFCVDWPRTIRLVYASISILTGIPIKNKKTKAFYDWATTGIPVTRSELPLFIMTSHQNNLLFKRKESWSREGDKTATTQKKLI